MGQSFTAGKSGIRNRHQLVTLHPKSGGRKLVLSYFLLFSQSTTPDPGMVEHTMSSLYS